MKNCFFEQGHIDTPLNDIGEKQAEIAGKALENVEFNRAYSSDLKRAHKTCQLILDQMKRLQHLRHQQFDLKNCF